MIRSPAPDYFLKFLKNEELFRDEKSTIEALKFFDKNNDQLLDINEFENFLKALFSFNGKPYPIPSEKIKEILKKYDTRQEENMNLNDFKKFWKKFVKQVIFPRSALVIVDVQNDFINGSLALKNCDANQDGVEVVPVINHLIKEIPFNVIAYTLDWHPEDHCSFITNVDKRPLHKYSPTKTNIKTYDSVIYDEYPDIEQKLWPVHCVQNSDGAKLHPDLIIVDEEKDAMKRSVVYTKKGSKSDIDSYSAFFDNCKLNETTLNSDLKKHGITDLYVCGLAADVCVAATSYDGLGLNYRVVFVEDACRGIDLKDIENQKNRLINHGAVVTDSSRVLNMINGRDRRPELAYSVLNYE